LLRQRSRSREHSPIWFPIQIAALHETVLHFAFGCKSRDGWKESSVAAVSAFANPSRLFEVNLNRLPHLHACKEMRKPRSTAYQLTHSPGHPPPGAPTRYPGYFSESAGSGKPREFRRVGTDQEKNGVKRTVPYSLHRTE
jgi:hypothetical protein